MKRQVIGKPKALTFTWISVIWLVVAICASIPLWAGGPFSGLDWLCVCLIAPEPVFVVMALVFWLIEPSRTGTRWRSNPDYNVRRLY